MSLQTNMADHTRVQSASQGFDRHTEGNFRSSVHNNRQPAPSDYSKPLLLRFDSDFLVRAYYHTRSLSAMVFNCKRQQNYHHKHSERSNSLRLVDREQGFFKCHGKYFVG